MPTSLRESFCRTFGAVTDGVYDLDAIPVVVGVEIGAYEHRSSYRGKGCGSEP